MYNCLSPLHDSDHTKCWRDLQIIWRAKAETRVLLEEGGVAGYEVEICLLLEEGVVAGSEV